MDRRKFITALGYTAVGASEVTDSKLLSAAAFPDKKKASSPESAATDAHSQPSILIGNYHSMMPIGISFIWNHVAGVVLNVGSGTDWKQGICAPDCSYTYSEFIQDGAKVEFEWGRVGEDSAVARIRSDKPVELLLKLPDSPWLNFHNSFSKVDKGVDAWCITNEGQYLNWYLRYDTEMVTKPGVYKREEYAIGRPLDQGVPNLALSVSVRPEHPIHLAGSFSQAPDLTSIDATLDKAMEAYKAHRAQASGSRGDFVGAITENLNNSRFYSSLNKRVGHIFARSYPANPWTADPDYLPYFVWDTSFSALLGSVEDPVHSKNTIRALLAYQMPDGKMPQVTNWRYLDVPYAFTACSNPPVTSMCAWKIHQRWPDLQFLKDVYPRLRRYHQWWTKNSDGNKNGLLEWGASNRTLFDAWAACGWDDTPVFEGCEMVDTQINIDAVDLNSLWSMDAECLSHMADALGLVEDAKELRAEQAHINQLMDKILWNEELGIYCHRFWNKDGSPGKFINRLSPMNFYPLICGAPDAQKAKRMLDIMTDPKKFWGRWILPTLAYDDKDWHLQGYWKGNAWPPANYLVWQGLKRYGTPEQKSRLADRSVEMFMQNWTTKGICGENFKSIDGMCNGFPHYTWGALLCLIGLEAFLDIGTDGRPVAGSGFETSKDTELRNIAAGGKRYRVSSNQGKLEINQE